VGADHHRQSSIQHTLGIHLSITRYLQNRHHSREHVEGVCQSIHRVLKVCRRPRLLTRICWRVARIDERSPSYNHNWRSNRHAACSIDIKIVADNVGVVRGVEEQVDTAKNIPNI
jgi:hypothetical protein